MVKEKEFLIQTLKDAGLKGKIYTSWKMVKQCPETHLGAVIQMGETYEASKQKTTFQDKSTGSWFRRIKKFEKVSRFKVVIAASKDIEAEETLETFLTLIMKGYVDNENWVSVAVKDAQWVDKDDSILRAAIAVELDVEFAGGIYKDRPLRRVDAVPTARKI